MTFLGPDAEIEIVGHFQRVKLFQEMVKSLLTIIYSRPFLKEKFSLSLIRSLTYLNFCTPF